VSNTIQTSITPAEAARRRAIVEGIRHSTDLEGGRSSDQVHAVQDGWARGEITLDELDAMVLELHPTLAQQ